MRTKKEIREREGERLDIGFIVSYGYPHAIKYLSLLSLLSIIIMLTNSLSYILKIKC